jgi:hypothetical protein
MPILLVVHVQTYSCPLDPKHSTNVVGHGTLTVAVYCIPQSPGQFQASLPCSGVHTSYQCLNPTAVSCLSGSLNITSSRCIKVKFYSTSVSSNLFDNIIKEGRKADIILGSVCTLLSTQQD